jgi:hypothetical protein
MNIECSHCGAANPEDSMFCGECGWQILPKEAELELEQAVVTAREKGGPADLAAKPEQEPAGREAEREPEPTISAKPDVEQAELAGEPDALPPSIETGPEPIPIGTEPEEELAELEVGPDIAPPATEIGPEPVVVSAEPEEEPAELVAGPDVTLPAIEVGPEPVVISAGPEAEPAGLDAVGERVQEPMPEALPSPAKPSDQYGPGVSITSSGAVLGKRTYAWGEIVSVSMESSPANRVPSLLLAAVGAIILALAVVGLRSNLQLGVILIAGGLLLLGIGAVLAATARQEYMVCVQTLSGVEAALVSTDRERVERIVQAMHRGRSAQDLPELA